MLKQNARSMSITSQESYSAVMIADLVAEVPIGPEAEQISAKTTKEETNLAYDAHLDGESKTIDGIDPANSHITNGGSISRGVILNAVQFGQSDSKTKIDEKGIQLTASLPIPPLPQQISEPKGFKDMSILRKIAFGFSFLPSVLFVLCFAIILPCNVPKPCVEELWVKTFNNTEAISNLVILENVMFTALDQQKSALMKLNKDSGDIKKKISLNGTSPHLKCGKILNAENIECIIMSEEGIFYTFDDTHSKLLWDPISEGEQPSPPVILPDCNGDKIGEIAMAVSNTKIKIMYGGSTSTSVTISWCDSIPMKVMPWITNGTSDIVFTCKKNNEDILVKIPNSMWCFYSKNPPEEASILYAGVLDSLKNAIIKPIENGLILWSGDEVSMIKSDGSQLWKVFNVSHSEENRHIFHGNFKGEKKQVALLSSSVSSGMKLSLRDANNGSILLKSSSFNDSEAIDVQVVKGENKDTILIFHKVKSATDILTTALSQINGISTTITNLISNDETASVTEPLISQKLSFLDQEGKLVTVKDIGHPDAVYKTTMKAIYEEEPDSLRVYILSTSENNAPEKITKVRNINIANWNKSKKSRCLGNVQPH